MFFTKHGRSRTDRHREGGDGGATPTESDPSADRRGEEVAELGGPDEPAVHRLEVLALCLAIVAILGRCIAYSRRWPFWTDEVYTALAAGDASFGHMIGALRDEINALPPLYLALGWGWACLFGASEVSLRLPSAFFIAAGMVAIWAALRRLTSRTAATFYAIILPLLVEEVRINIFEARCYALYFAAYAVAVALYLRCTARPERSRSFYAAVAIVHGVVVAVHYVGGLFSAVLVVAALVSGWLGRDGRLVRYGLSAAIGWIAVIPSLPFLAAQRKLSTEYNWIAPPTPKALLDDFGGIVSHLPLAATLLIFSWVVAEWIDGEGAVRRPGRALREAAVLLAVTIGFVPAVWLESRWGARIFIPRYLFLTSIIWVVILGCAFGWLNKRLLGARGKAGPRPVDGPGPPRWVPPPAAPRGPIGRLFRLGPAGGGGRRAARARPPPYGKHPPRGSPGGGPR